MYTGGLTEEEQFERAMRNSLNDRGKDFVALSTLSYYSYWRIKKPYSLNSFQTINCKQSFDKLDQAKVTLMNFQGMQSDALLSFFFFKVEN